MKADSKVGLVPNAGHTANIEQPEIYHIMLDNFFEVVLSETISK